MENTCNLSLDQGTINEIYYPSINTKLVSKVKEALLTLLDKGYNIEEIVKMIKETPRKYKHTPSINMFITDEKLVRDFLLSPKIIDLPKSMTIQTKELGIDNPDAIVLTGKRAKVWLSEAWGVASLAQNKFIQDTNREIQSKILKMVLTASQNENAEDVLNITIQEYFNSNLLWLADFFERLGKPDYALLIRDNMPFEGKNPNLRILYIIKSISDYFSEYSDSDKMAYTNPKNPNYDKAKAFAKFLLILPLNFDNFLSSNVNSIKIRNKGKLVVDINKYGIQLGKGRQNQTWLDEDSIYTISRMVDDFVLMEIGSWNLYRKQGKIWTKQEDEFCDTTKVIGVLTKILKIADVVSSGFEPIINNLPNAKLINDLKDTFRVAFGINLETKKEIIEEVFTKYIEGKTIPEIIANINLDPHHLLPIIMYLLTELNRSSSKSIIETNVLKSGIILLNDNEVNIIHSIWHNMFDPLNKNSLYNLVSSNREFDLYQMVTQALLTHDKKELYGIVNDMGTVEKKNYSIGRANQRLNYLLSKINGFYSPLLNKQISRTAIVNDFLSDEPSTTISYTPFAKKDVYEIKITKGSKISLSKNGTLIISNNNVVGNLLTVLQALKDLLDLFENSIKLNFTDDFLSIYINKIGGGQSKALLNLVSISANLIYASEISKYLTGESTSDFKNKLRNFYNNVPNLVRGVTYNLVDAFSGKMFPKLAELSVANDINEGIIGDIVVKGGAGEQINSVILRTLTTQFSQFVLEKSLDEESAIRHFSIRDAFKRMTFLRDYVDKTGEVKSSTDMNVEEFFLNSFIYDFYGDSLAIHLGVLSDKPNIPKMELYVDTPILVDPVNNVVKPLKDCSAEDLKKVVVRELGYYYFKMKLEMDRNLAILTKYSPLANSTPGFKYDINSDYTETRAFTLKELIKDIHDAIYLALLAGEDIEINEYLYFSWDKNKLLHTKPSLISELRKHDVKINSFGLLTENSELFFKRKEHELIVNLLLDLKHGISFVDSLSLKVIDSSAVRALRKANKDWSTKRHVIIGKILYGDKSKNLVTKESLTDWKIYKDFIKYAKEVGNFNLDKLNINGNFDFLYFLYLLNSNWDNIQEYSQIESLKGKLKREIEKKLSSPTISIDKLALIESYRQWRLDNIEETEVERNQAVLNYATEEDERVWIRRNKAFLTEGIQNITSLEEIELYKELYNLNDFDTTLSKEDLSFSLEINPEISRYNTLHYLYSEEGLNSTVGSHINHKAPYETNLSLLGAIETGQLAKRNVSESGAKNQYTRGDIEGESKTMTIAVVKDVKAGISTVNGIENPTAAVVMDGATVGNYVTRKEELHSLGSQKAGIENSKPLGNDLNPRTGTGTIIKTAVFVLTNGRIRSSERNIILHKHMNSIPWDPRFNGDFLHDFNGNEIKYRPVIVYKPSTQAYYLRSNFVINSDGTVSFEELQISNNQIKNNVLNIPIDRGVTIGSLIREGKDINPYIKTIAAVIKPKLIGNKISNTITTNRPIRTNYELWDLFGGAYSASINDLNELSYEDDNTSLDNLTIACHSCGTRLTDNSTRLTEQDVWLPLKKAKIDWVVTEGAIKLGAANINSTEMFTNINYNVTTQKIATADIGMQLNPEHLVDRSHVTLMTLVVNALGLRGFSADAADKVYQALATLTDFSLQELFQGIELRRNTGDDTKFKEAVSSLLLKSIIGTQETDGDLLSSIVIQLNKLDRNGHDYDIIKHRLPISDPAILNKLISNFSALMTKAGVRIQFPGSMNVLVPSDGIYRIHGGKLRKFASTQRYKDSKASKILRNIINLKGYAIVWAHPGIGKSYSVEQGQFSNRIIDWDVEYNRRRDLWIAEHSNTKIGTKKFDKAKYEYLVNYEKYPDYVQFLTENWERVKQIAKQEKKILVVSPHSLLKIFSNDFDEIINLSDETFIERNVQRGGNTEDSINLKNDLNSTINSLNNPNLVSTNLYLEEILDDTFNNGNLLENNEEELELQELLELQSLLQPLAGLHAITIGGSYFINLITEEELEPWDELSAKILAGESIKIDDLSTYYKVRDILKGSNYSIIEDVISGRELAPYNCTFNTDRGMYMLWDLDSIKHIHMVENDKAKMLEIYMTYSDEEIAREFHINPQELNKTDYDSFRESFKRLINRRRQIELNSIGSGNNNSVYIDGQLVKIDKSTLSVSPYELIAPKNYETDFGLRVGDDVQDIVKDKFFFLRRMLRTHYQVDKSGHWVDRTPINSLLYDILLKTISGRSYPILFKLDDSVVPEGLLKITDLEFFTRFDWEGSKVYWLDEDGNRLYLIPYHLNDEKKIVYDAEILVDELGNEVIYTDNINSFVNNLYFNHIDFGKHILQISNVYKIFNQLKNSKKRSVNRLFQDYIESIPEYSQVLKLESSIKEKTKKNLDVSKLNQQLSVLTNNEDLNTAILAKINDHLNLRDKNLAKLSLELEKGEVNENDYFGMFRLMIVASVESHTSFIKSLDYIASRTPAQSHLSFMPMKLVAFDESGKNSAYVSRYQLYLQGSDFDVDKASLLGSIIRNGIYVKWSPFMNLSSIEALRLSEKLPFPTGKTLEISDNLSERVYDKMDKPIHLIWHDDTRITFILPNFNLDIHLFKNVKGIWVSDLTKEMMAQMTPMEVYLIERAITDKIPEGELFDAYFNIRHLGFNENLIKDSSLYDYNYDFTQFARIFKSIWEKRDNGQFYFDTSNSLNLEKLSILINALNSFGKVYKVDKEDVIGVIRRTVDAHNTFFNDKDSSDGKDAVVNYISSNMFQISSDPVNLVEAMTSVDLLTEYIKEIAKQSPLAELSKHFDKGNVMSLYRLLRLTLSGKQNTGIEASSLKVMEAINQYLDVILNYGSDEELKSLITPIEIGGYKIGLICNAYCKNIANIKSKEVYDALLEINNDEDLALWLSAFLSLSTDNAKDPTLSKINANPEMIGLYNAGFVLGLPIDFLSKVIMSPTGMTIAEIQLGNVFLGYNSLRNINNVIKYIKGGPRLNLNLTTIEIFLKAILAYAGEVEVNAFNLTRLLMPKYWDQSLLLIAKRIINLAKSLAYGKDGEEIKYNLPSVQSRLSKDIQITKSRISGMLKSILALEQLIAEKESLNKKHLRLDKDLTKLTTSLVELQERLNSLQEIRNEYEVSQTIPLGEEGSVLEEYRQYLENLESLESGELSEILRKTFEDYKDYIKESYNFRKAVLDLEDWINVLEQIQLDEGYTDSEGKKHNTLTILNLLNEFASEMSLIRPNLSLNQQLPNSKENLLAFIKKFENIINDRLAFVENKDVEEIEIFRDINASRNINGLNISISEFVWDEDYRKAAIKAYDSIKYKVNTLDVLVKVKHYFGYLKACDALYESLKYQTVQYRELDRIIEKVIIGELGIRASKDILARAKIASRYISRLINNMFMLNKNVELSIPKITDGKVDSSIKVPIKLGTKEGNEAFKQWMDLVIIPKFKRLYKSNKFAKELSEATYHKSDNHNTIINYTTGIDTMTSNPTEVTKFAEVTEDFNKLVSVKMDGIPLVDAFFYYDLIAYDRLPGQLSLTPIFNKLVSLGNTQVILDYTEFVSDLDLGGNYILTLDESQIDEIKRFIAPVISIYALDDFNEEYGWVKDPVDLQYYLIKRKPKQRGGYNEEIETMDDPILDDMMLESLGLEPDGDVNSEEGYTPVTLESKLNRDKYEIISNSENLNSPYMSSFLNTETQSALEGQVIISPKEIRIGNETITLKDGELDISEKAKERLKKITGLKNVDDLIVTKIVINGYSLDTVIDVDTTKDKLENPCKQ